MKFYREFAYLFLYMAVDGLANSRLTVRCFFSIKQGKTLQECVYRIYSSRINLVLVILGTSENTYVVVITWKLFCTIPKNKLTMVSPTITIQGKLSFQTITV
jgi:hypothetical protein